MAPAEIHQKYKIEGMSCNGCRQHVQEILESISGVERADISLEESSGNLYFKKKISLKTLQKALANDGGHYQIYAFDKPKKPLKPKAKNKEVPTGVYYCPMRCEGDKTYNQPGDCPVCGMDLVPETTQEDATPSAYQKLLKKLIWSVVFTLPVFIIAMSEMIPGKPLQAWWSQNNWNYLQFALSLPVVFYTCRMFFERAYKSVINRHLNMFTLIGLGAGVAFVYSVAALFFPEWVPAAFKSESGHVYVYFEAVTVILTLVLLGQLLEARAHEKTDGALRALIQLSPSTAWLIKDGQETEVDVKTLQKGDIIRMKPGGRIPVDGTIEEGESWIDESMLTGESVPVHKVSGDKVHAGTLNGNQAFAFRAVQIGADTLLSQIIDLVKKAGSSKAPIQRVADRVSGYFVPVVIAISLLTFLAWNLWGPEPSLAYAFVNAVAVLIIACPCALGLATPISVMVGVGKAAQNGVLIKNAEALEKLRQMDVLVVDKTGTLTEGKLKVEKAEGPDTEKILKLSAAVNQHSEHPFAGALRLFAQENQLEVPNAQAFEAVTGKGVKARVGEQAVLMGTKKLMEENGITISDEWTARAMEHQQKGKSVSFLSVDARLSGFVVFSDQIKKNAPQTLDKLKKLGIQVHMLTGDQPASARAVATQLGITHFKAACLPADKLEEIERLQQNGHTVGMAGDGVNDAPALAKADIGIAMATGTDVALESAQISLLKGDLDGLAKAIYLSKAVMKNIHQNLFFAFIYNSLGVPLAAGALYPIFGILLSPMIAAAAMSFSSVSVITNALRLKRVKL